MKIRWFLFFCVLVALFISHSYTSAVFPVRYSPKLGPRRPGDLTRPVHIPSTPDSASGASASPNSSNHLKRRRHHRWIIPRGPQGNSSMRTQFQGPQRRVSQSDDFPGSDNFRSDGDKVVTQIESPSNQNSSLGFRSSRHLLNIDSVKGIQHSVQHRRRHDGNGRKRFRNRSVVPSQFVNNHDVKSHVEGENLETESWAFDSVPVNNRSVQYQHIPSDEVSLPALNNNGAQHIKESNFGAKSVSKEVQISSVNLYNDSEYPATYNEILGHSVHSGLSQNHPIDYTHLRLRSSHIKRIPRLSNRRRHNQSHSSFNQSYHNNTPNLESRIIPNQDDSLHHVEDQPMRIPSRNSRVQPHYSDGLHEQSNSVQFEGPLVFAFHGRPGDCGGKYPCGEWDDGTRNPRSANGTNHFHQVFRSKVTLMTARSNKILVITPNGQVITKAHTDGKVTGE